MKFLALISEKLTFATVTLLFGFGYALRDQGCTFAAALIVIASLAAHIWEKTELKKESQSETDQLKKDVKALQDRVGRAELSIGMKLKT